MDPRANRRIIVTTVFLAGCVLTLLLSLLVLRSAVLAAAAAVGIAGFVVLFIEPFVGIYIYIVLLYIRPQDFVPGLVGKPIMLVLGVATAGLVILHKAVVKRSLTIAHSPQNGLLMWFYGAIVVSELATLNLTRAVSATMDFVSIITMYFLISNLVTTPRRFRLVWQLLVGLTLALSIQGLVMHATGVGLGGQEMYEGRIQAIGIFSDPNDLAMAITTVMPLTVLAMLGSPRLGSRLVATIANGVFVTALILTESRGGLLSFGALVLILFAKRFGRIIGLAAGGAIMMALFVLGPRMSSISTGEASAYGRIEAWGKGLDLFQQHPLFGVGFGNFLEYHFRTAHNSFVLCATELGLFGLYPWTMMIFLSIKNSHFVAAELRTRGDTRFAMYADALEYGVIAFIMNAYFLSRTYHELLFILIALNAAMVHMFASGQTQRYQLIEKRDFVYGFAWVVGCWLVTKGFLFVAW